MTDIKRNVHNDSSAAMKISDLDEGDDHPSTLQIDLQHYRHLVRTFIDLVR